MSQFHHEGRARRCIHRDDVQIRSRLPRRNAASVRAAIPDPPSVRTPNPREALLRPDRDERVPRLTVASARSWCDGSPRVVHNVVRTIHQEAIPIFRVCGTIIDDFSALFSMMFRSKAIAGASILAGDRDVINSSCLRTLRVVISKQYVSARQLSSRGRGYLTARMRQHRCKTQFGNDLTGASAVVRTSAAMITLCVHSNAIVCFLIVSSGSFLDRYGSIHH